MGDIGLSSDEKFSEEQHRLSTFRNSRFVSSVENAQLAKAGFFLVQGEDHVKCFSCGLEVKASDFIGSDHVDVLAFHKTKKPACPFIQTSGNRKFVRRKTFLSATENLQFENARFDTFVDWPITFMSPAELAKDGFYFLRTSDHCACIFCKGIIGAWEETDTPRGEHLKHFPHCPFVKGQPVGNIPMAQSLILNKYYNFMLSKVSNPVENNLSCNSEDVTGLGKERHCNMTQKMNGLNLQDIGLDEYRGPLYMHYITLDSRINSFKRWPEYIKQQPQELAAAGFYYCGPTDHVRCFHCGKGICNWEEGDIPWEVHAAWYPKCNYVLLTKGKEYVSKVQKEMFSETNGNSQSLSITESELSNLMELDVMRALLALGVPEGPARETLRKKLGTTGLPFFSIEECMDAAFLFMNNETQQFLENIAIEDSEGEESNVSASESSPSISQSSRNTTTRSDTLASAPTSSTSPPQLPPSAGHGPILPLPQLRTLVPTTPLLPRENNGNDSRASEVPAVGREAPLSLPNISQVNQRQTASGVAVQSDFSEEQSEQKQVPRVLAEVGLDKKFVGSLEQESSDNLQEELDRAREIMTCKVCLNAEMTVVFLPCSHMAACASCAVNLSTCPVCRGEIKYTIKPIFT